jgi:hypothetical protein
MVGEDTELTSITGGGDDIDIFTQDRSPGSYYF